MKNQSPSKKSETGTFPIQENVIIKETKSTFVVVRDGIRVSDKEYSTENDSSAINELTFWSKIAKKHSHGEPVKIVPYDSKKHKVW